MKHFQPFPETVRLERTSGDHLIFSCIYLSNCRSKIIFLPVTAEILFHQHVILQKGAETVKPKVSWGLHFVVPPGAPLELAV